MKTEVTMDEIDQAFKLIDGGLNDLQGHQIAEANEMTDILLDLRALLTSIKEFIEK